MTRLTVRTRLMTAIAAYRPQRREAGAVLVMGAAFMLVLLLLASLLWGISYRVRQRQTAESALREGTRTAIQLWQYAGFANDAPTLRDDGLVVSQAQAVVAANLASVPGLIGNPVEIVREIEWSILSAGASCDGVTVTGPALCARMQVPVRSLPLGLPGIGTLHLTTVSTFDTAP